MAATKKQIYIYGNTVRQPGIVPERKEQELPSQPKKVSRQVKQNRKKAQHMSMGYVLFLSVAAVFSLVICIGYLQLRTNTTSRSHQITALQQELSSVKEANATAYDVASNSVTLDMVKEKAMTELGMVPAQEGQVVKYQSPSNDYIKQYENIPKSGVLATSSKASK